MWNLNSGAHLGKDSGMYATVYSLWAVAGGALYNMGVSTAPLSGPQWV